VRSLKGYGVDRDTARELLMRTNGNMNDAALLITEKGTHEKRKRNEIRKHKDTSSQSTARILKTKPNAKLTMIMMTAMKRLNSLAQCLIKCRQQQQHSRRKTSCPSFFNLEWNYKASWKSQSV